MQNSQNTNQKDHETPTTSSQPPESRRVLKIFFQEIQIQKQKLELESERKELAIKHEKMKDLSVKYEENQESLVGKLKEKINELEEVICTLSQQTEDFKKQERDLCQMIITLKSTLEEHESELDRLGEELEIKNRQNDTLVKRCLDLEKLVQEIKALTSNSSHS